MSLTLIITYFRILLISCKLNLGERAQEILKSHLSTKVVDNDVQGWEECVDAAMTQLLRTVLAKSSKDANSTPVPIQMPTGTLKLQRHVGVVCNRLSQYGYLE